MRFILIIIVLLQFTCRSRMVSNDECNTVGKVIKSELEQCGLLIEIDDGVFLLPINREEYNLQANTEIKFSYKEVVDMMSICMAEDQMITITCLNVTKPRSKDCRNFESVDSGWIKDSLGAIQPTMIKKYNYLDGYAYWFTGGIQKERLIDCQGTVLCSADHITADNCDRVPILTHPIELYVAHR